MKKVGNYKKEEAAKWKVKYLQAKREEQNSQKLDKGKEMCMEEKKASYGTLYLPEDLGFCDCVFVITMLDMQNNHKISLVQNHDLTGTQVQVTLSTCPSIRCLNRCPF